MQLDAGYGSVTNDAANMRLVERPTNYVTLQSKKCLNGKYDSKGMALLRKHLINYGIPKRVNVPAA